MFTSILCPVDFSDASARALRKAIAIANLSHAHLTLLHVTDPLLESAARAAGTADVIRRQTQDELRKLLDDVSPGGVTGPMGVAVAVGPPAQEILRQAAESDADLIVMGTQGRGAAELFFLGSTAKRVVQSSPIPVLVVPPERA